ncbi:serine carboxypeptidase S28-domain-containing protein [Parasitella parasitica]|nr:serine carboxypeptidase S28-domain-containing protein [Parasitella parasitica]
MLVQICHGLGLYGGRTLSTKSRNIYSIRPNAVKSDESLPQKYGPFVMEMPLDHFSSNGPNTTFKNRYWVNTDYYQPNGPILFTNAGEAAVDDANYAIFNSTIAQLAQRLGGIFIYMEHRFYGSSGPDDFEKELSKLTVEQALADMAYLLDNVKFSSKLDVPRVPKTKVIVYGCSYSGSLAAWMKDKYADIIFASVASSAPVQAQFNFYQYFDPIIRYAPAPCINSIRNLISVVDNILFGNNTKQIDALKKLFNAEELYNDDFASRKLLILI